MSKLNGKHIDLPLCACGCGDQVSKPKNKYILGHHTRVIDCAWSRGLTKNDHPGLKKIIKQIKRKN